MERNVYHRLDQLEGEHRWFCARRRILKSVIARFAPRSSTRLRLLEAGCGTGGNLRMLSEFGSLDAFELDDEARDIACRKLPIDVKSGMLPDDIARAAGPGRQTDDDRSGLALAVEPA
jgi:SAM-dependent methyltransferase